MAGLNRTALVVLLVVLACGTLTAQGRQPPVELLSGPQLQEHLLAASAWIHATDCGQGTGFVIDARRRWMVTNYHVVADNSTAEVWFPARVEGQIQSARSWYLQHRQELQEQGLLITARVLRRDKSRDLALLELPRIPQGVAALPLAARAARPGDAVSALGCRYDSPSLWTFGQGSIRQLRTLTDGYFSSGKQLARGVHIFQANLPINEGDSGAALINERGAVVGVAAAVAWEHRGDGYFIAVPDLEAFLGQSRDKAPPAEDRMASLYEKVLPSVVLILSSLPEQGKEGPGNLRGRHTGLVLDRQRRLLLTTADSCGPGGIVYLACPRWEKGKLRAEVQQTLESGRLIRGVILARDPRRDLALIEAESLPPEAQSLPRADRLPRIGELLHTLGNPDRLDVLWLYASGCLRQTGRFRLSNDRDDAEVLVLLVQLATGDGDGGSPLVNSAGELVGLQTGKATPQQQLTYALPLSEMEAFLAEKKSSWDPQRLEDWIVRARLFLQWHRPERALADLEVPLKQTPVPADAALEASRAQQMLNHPDKALQSIERAIQSDPRLAGAYSQRASLRLANGEIEAALADCQQALQRDREDATAFRIRGEVHQARAAMEAARQDLDQAIWLDRKSAAGYFARGRLLARQEKWDEALADFNQALILDPVWPGVHRQRAELFWSRADWKSAGVDYEQALALDPSDALAWLGKARISQHRGDNSGALTCLAQAVRHNPHLASAYLLQAQLLLEARDYRRAASALIKVLFLQPSLLPEAIRNRHHKNQPG